MEVSDLFALLALIVAAIAAVISICQTLVARDATRHAADSATAAKTSAAAAVEANRLASISAEVAQNQEKRESLKGSRELTGWVIDRAADHTDYKITNVGHEFAILHALTGPTNPQLYDAPVVLHRNDSFELHIEESEAPSDRFVVVVWTDRGQSWSRNTVPLP